MRKGKHRDFFKLNKFEIGDEVVTKEDGENWIICGIFTPFVKSKRTPDYDLVPVIFDYKLPFSRRFDEDELDHCKLFKRKEKLKKI